MGRVLARIGALRRSLEVDNGQVGGDSRVAILDFVESAQDPVRVEDISAAVGLHPNTVRGHLDSLLAAGRISRIPDERSTRGRPHWLYSATSAAHIDELAHALDHELKTAPAPDVARRAAAAWAKAAPVSEPVGTINGAVDQATEALVEFGFEAARNLVGDEISLSACPYASLVREHPVICDIHAALLAEILNRSAQPVTLDRIDVWPQPGVCVAHLNRPDANPERTVKPIPNPGKKHR